MQMKYIRAVMSAMKVKHIRRKIRYPFILGMVRFMIAVSQIIPRSLWLSFCGALGLLAYAFATKSRKITIRNLTMAYGPEKTPTQIRHMAREVFHYMGKNAGDIIRAFPITDETKLSKFLVVNGSEPAIKAYEQKRGLLLMTAHLGAFELAATQMALLGLKPMIIGTVLKDQRLTALVWKQRSKIGASAIERGKETIRLLKNLKSGGTVGILIDQDTRVQSVFVNFFGMPCATPVGAAVLALKTGAAVLPVFVHLRADGKQEINFYPEIELIRSGNEAEDIRLNTQRFNDVIEAEIRKYPTQWVWMHERWKTRPGEEIPY
jgi:Kdo2-lipid IVA lauroyltransferase/acyltransferase